MGPIALSPGVIASFEEYQARDAPLYFAVTEGGRGSYYLHCVGGFNCTACQARMRVLDRCRSHYPGNDCKLYAVGRSVVWQDLDPAPELSASARMTRECLAGDTPSIRIDKCSEAIASPELAEGQKRGPFYVRARAYEQIGDWPQAEQNYRAVLSIDPGHVAARARLDRLLAPAASPE